MATLLEASTMNPTTSQIIVFLTLLILSFICGAFAHAGFKDWEEGNKGSWLDNTGFFCLMIFAVLTALDIAMIIKLVITHL